MKKIQTFIYVLLMGFAFAACQDDSLGGTEQGGIRIALTDGTAGVDVTTRSTPSELFDGFKQKFKFQIKGGDNYDQTHDWTKDVIPLAAGVYDITATCGTEQADGLVEFDKPCYTGTKEGLKVNAGETATTAEISCKVTNALVSLKFVEENEADFADAYAMIAVGTGAETRWDPLTKSAYFKAGSSLSKLTIFKDGSDSKGADILTDAQKDANFPKTFAAGDHLILTLSIAKANGNAAIKVSKVEVKKVTIEETIPLEWLPKPKMTAEGFTDNQLVMYESETPTAKFNFNLSSGLQELKFTLNFKDETYNSLNKEYVLSTLSESDRQVLTDAGVVLPSIGAKGDVSLDFSGLAAKLTGAINGSSLDNVITLTEVMANNRVLEEGEQTYTIQTYAPEFDIKVYPGNTWTKQFTANTEITKGNAEVIRKNMTFEYSTNGSNWTSSKDSLIAGLTPGTAYQVRAKFGKHVTEVVNAKTYPVIELTNGGLEDYSTIKGADKTSSQYGAQYEWTNWCTLNDLTCDKCTVLGVGNTAFNSRSGTRPSNIVREGSDGNTSAWICTIGFGYGGTSYKHVVPGELYLGTLTNVNHDEDTATKNYGMEFKTRPRALQFYYKYAPYDGDQSDIYIQVLSKEGDILGSASLNETQNISTYQKCILEIKYDDNYKNLEPEKLVVVFKSGNKTSVEARGNTSVVGTGDPAYRGSELYIDDVSLVYDK